MDDAKDLSNQNQDDLADDALESVGVNEPVQEIAEEANEKSFVPHMKGDGNSGKEIDLPEGVKSRLGRQEKRHQREMRQMRAQLDSMQQMFSQQPNGNQQQVDSSYGEPSSSVDEQIHKAVSAALYAQDEQKRRAKERELADHVNRKYEDLNNHLDKASDKYDDFEDVVRGQDAPFTTAMRDAALFLDNPAEVLYKLGKNKDELKRIAQLHPVDQAREMVKLSHALMSGNGNSSDKGNSPRSIGQIKSNPVNPSSVNERTPVGELRRRMKAGEWKSNR